MRFKSSLLFSTIHQLHDRRNDDRLY